MSASQAEITEGTLQAEDGMDQYLTFMLADEEYGVDILRVQEIKGWDGVTPMPNMPDFILGVINLRGTVVPIIDLRRHFDLESIPYDKTTVVIVGRISDGENGERTVGMVVDAVSEVHNISASELKPPPDFGGNICTESIKGLATKNERMIIMLDIDHLMNNGVMSALEQAENAGTPGEQG